ncbi:alpha/beta-hydrolase [Ceratobasidium sp. AG-I]|nr:alpha/beta-hydrolase [Ceratobasidium sp. AG-I]
MRIHRPISQSTFQALRINSRKRKRDKSSFGLLDNWEQSLGWEEHDVEGPATDKRETLLALAKMTSNAYFSKGSIGWYDLGTNWTSDHNIGWDSDSDGFRGHVFVSADNKTAVLSIKGTSAGLFGGNGMTVRKDKLNDNLLFSCCCARVDWTWSTVCGCFGGENKCDQNCLEESLEQDSLFYPVGVNLYNNLTFMYPDAKIWVVGHSLGGALASLIGVTFGAPTVAFEAPGERMAAQRLHLPIPPSTQHITHVLNTADPVAMGTCNGPTSSCYLGGYALESKCHLGTSIVYDTVSALHWPVGLQAHFTVTITEQLLDEDWSEKVRKARRRWWLPWSPDDGGERVEVPPAAPEEDCVECFAWEYGDYLNKTG